MSVPDLLDMEVVMLLKDKGFGVAQDGFNLTFSCVDDDIFLSVIATVDGVRFYADNGSGETTGETVVIPWSAFGKLQDAIEQAILAQADRITLRHEITAKMNQKEDEDDKH